MIDYRDTHPFVETYPAGHELEGQSVEREQECSRCGQTFTQSKLHRDWLNAFHEHSPGAIQQFLKTCQVEVVDGKRHVYQPARCHHCERALLNPEPPNPAESTGALRTVK